MCPKCHDTRTPLFPTRMYEVGAEGGYSLPALKCLMCGWVGDELMLYRYKQRMEVKYVNRNV